MTEITPDFSRKTREKSISRYLTAPFYWGLVAVTWAGEAASDFLYYRQHPEENERRKEQQRLNRDKL